MVNNAIRAALLRRRNVVATAGDDEPTLTIDLDSTTVGRGTSWTFTRGDSATQLATANVEIVDPGGLGLDNIKIVVSGVQDGANEVLALGADTFPLNANKSTLELVGGVTFAIEYVTATQTFTLTNNAGGKFSVAAAIAAIEAITQVFSGTPTYGVRTFSFTVEADSVVSAPAVATVSVVDQSPVIDAIADTTATVGVEKTVTPNNSGGPATLWEITSGTGGSINPSTGVFTYTPSAEGTTNWTIRASNSGGSDTEDFAITSSEAPPGTPLTIDNTGGPELTNYQVPIDFTFESGMAASFQDIRVKSSDGLTTFPIWRQPDSIVASTSCRIWVKIPTIPADDTLDIIYTFDGSTTDADDFANVFDAGDDFAEQDYWWFVNGYDNISEINRGPDDNLYAIGRKTSTANATMLKSTDGGLSWSEIGEVGTDTHRSFMFDPTDENVIYAVSNNGQTIRKSTNNGSSWSNHGSCSTVNVAGDAQLLWVSASLFLMVVYRKVPSGNRGVDCYRSTNDGVTWSFLSTVCDFSLGTFDSIEDCCLVMAPNGNIVCSYEKEVVEKGNATTHCKISTDNGATWGSEIDIETTGSRDNEGVSLLPAGSSDIYAIYAANASGASYDNNQFLVRKSTDNGATWGSSSSLYTGRFGVEFASEWVDDTESALVFATARLYQTSWAWAGIAKMPSIAGMAIDGWSTSNPNAATADIVYDGSIRRARLDGFTNSAVSYFINDTPVTGNQTYEFRVRESPQTGSANSDVRLVFGYQDELNHYLLLFKDETAVRLFKRVANNTTVIGTGTTLSVPGTWMNVTVKHNTTTKEIRVDIDGVNEIAITEGTVTFTGGKFGCGVTSVLLSQHIEMAYAANRKHAADEPTVA